MTKLYQPRADGVTALDGFGRCYSRLVYTSKESALAAMPDFIERCMIERGVLDLGTLSHVEETGIIELEVHE